jgi:hypothetical protein
MPQFPGAASPAVPFVQFQPRFEMPKIDFAAPHLKFELAPPLFEKAIQAYPPIEWKWEVPGFELAPVPAPLVTKKKVIV